ncbi:hypothetical protein [Tenacibaculum xiamenense]|uniref:hypothetical protein n=1 Tax=Tenacibaculum xiamenense TaxID=1261553 RepID=UPI003895A45C
MLNNQIIRKRAESLSFSQIAGEFYINENSSTIKSLKKTGGEAFLGIRNKEGLYTVIGKDYLFFCDRSGFEKRVLNKDLWGIIKRKLRTMSKNDHIEFIQISDNDSIWVLNTSMFSIISSLILFLTRKDGLGIAYPSSDSSDM